MKKYVDYPWRKNIKPVTEKFLKENIGKKIFVVELVTNDEEELGIGDDMVACDTLEIAEKECEYRNETNYDKKYKYIVVDYNVLEKFGDLVLECY